MIRIEIVRARDGGDSFAFQAGPQRYLCREPEGTYRELSLDWDASLIGLLSEYSRLRPDPSVAAELGRRLRALALGTGLEREASRLAEGAGGSVELALAAAELFALPWELLPLGASGLGLGQAPGLRLLRRWPGAAPRPRAPTPPAEPGRILLAWSEAGGRCGWEAHLEALRTCAQPAGVFDPARDRLPRASLRALAATLEAACRKGRPYTTLHLICHGRAGSQGGALLLDGAGEQGVDGATLSGALAPFLDTLRLVVLCACSAAAHGAPGGLIGGAALALHRAGVEAVLAPGAPIPLTVAERLTAALYAALLQDRLSLEEAVARVRQEILLLGGLSWATPHLFAHPQEGEDLRPFTLRPYRGLLPFEPEHRGLFFGRELELQALQERVEAAGRGALPALQFLCGSSGVGKSSLVRAGLTPALAERGWECRWIAPGPELDAALQEPPEPGPALWVVEPWQDLLALPEVQERDAKVQALQSRVDSGGLVILGVIRVDWLARCEEVLLRGGARLDALLYDPRHHSFLAALTPERLERAIEAPALRLGLRLEPGLVRALLDEIGHDPGALPLLQLLLDRLWLAREERALTHRALRALGGLSGVLARTADAVLDRLDAEERSLVFSLLVPLVEPGLDGGPARRRRLPLARLLPADPAQALRGRSLLEALADARLLSLAEGEGGPWVELAHDALLQRWVELRERVQAQEDERRRLAELERWAREWLARRADTDGGLPYLLRGSRLGYALELAERAGRLLAPEVGELIGASVAHEREAQELARQQLEQREALAQAATASAARARDAALLATARARRAEDPTLALLVLRAVGRPRQPLDWTREALGLLGEPICVAETPPRVDRVLISVSPRAEPWALWARGPEILLGPLAEEAPRWARAIGAPAACACWSADGERLFVGTAEAEVFCAGLKDDLRALASLPAAPSRLALSPDGGLLAVGDQDGRVRLLPVAGGEALTLGGHSGAITDLDWSADGEQVLSASVDGSARLWRRADRSFSVLRGPRGALNRARFSPRGGRVLLLGEDGLVRVWDPARGRAIAEQTLPSPARAGCWWWDGSAVVGDASGRLLVLSQDGRARRALQASATGLVALSAGRDGRLRARSEDGTVRLWSLDACSDAPRQERLPERRAHALRWSADGSFLAVSAGERTLSLLSPDGAARELGSGAPLDTPRALALDPLGQAIALACEDDAIWLLDLQGAPLASLRRQDCPLRALSWSPDGARLACGDADGGVRVLDRALRVQERLHQDHEIRALAFDPAGQVLLIHSADGRLTLWDPQGELPLRLGEPRLKGQVEPGGAVVAATWTGARGRALVARADGRVEVVELGAPGIFRLAELGSRPRALCAHPGGLAVVATEDARVRVLPPDGGNPRELRHGLGLLRGVELDARAERLLALEESGRLWIIDVGDDGDPLELDLGGARALLAAFDPASERVAAAGDDGTLRIWPLSTGELLTHLARASDLSLSPDQRRRYLGER